MIRWRKYEDIMMMMMTIWRHVRMIWWWWPDEIEAWSFPRLQLSLGHRQLLSAGTDQEMNSTHLDVWIILWSYLILAGSTTSGASEKILSSANFSGLNAKECIFYTFGGICCNFWVFCVVFGCTNLGLTNPACVKEITNMRYDYD